MKKIICLIISIVLMMSLCITSNAAGSSTINGNTSVTVGSEIEFTVNVSGCGNATSVAVAVNFDAGFELVSGTWLKNGSINKFDTTTNKGALGGLSSPDVNGNLFKVVLKAKTVSADLQNVSVNVIAKNGSNEIMNVTPSKSVKINCATHSYDNYTNANTTSHTRTCSTCGNVETSAHTWNSGTVTKTANCKETGTKTYTCTATGCGAVKTETIAKTTNHTYGSWSQTKAPTCTTKGTETRICLTCQKTETRDINALGHKFSNPTVTKKPTCTETGIESGKCTRCNKTTTNTLKATGHKMSEYKVTLEPTCTQEGKKEGSCSVCGAKAEEKIAMKDHSYGSFVITKEATETEEGLKTQTCMVCGNVKEEVIPVLSAQQEILSEDTDNKVILNEDKVVSDNEVTDNEVSDNSNQIFTIIIIIIMLIIIGCVIFFIIKKKKRKK